MVSKRAQKEASNYLALPVSQRQAYYQKKSVGVKRLIDAGLSARGQQRVNPYKATGTSVKSKPKPKPVKPTKNAFQQTTHPTKHSQRQHFEIQWTKGVKKRTAWADIIKYIKTVKLGSYKKISYYFRVNGIKGTSISPHKLTPQKFLNNLLVEIYSILTKLEQSKIKYSEFEMDIITIQ